MIDIQERSSTFKWVCISLFMLTALLYFRGCEIKPYSNVFFSILFYTEYEDASLLAQWPWGTEVRVGTDHHVAEVRLFRDLSYLLAYEAVGYQHFHIVWRILGQAVHLIVSICVFILMRRLTGNTLVGISAAVLFVGSYFNSETVCVVWTMDDLNVCMFGLLSVIFYIRYFDGKGIYNYLLALMFMLMACLEKQTSIMIPLIIFLVDIYLRREAGERRVAWRNSLSLRGIKTCLPFFLLSILCLLFTVCCLENSNVEVAINVNRNYFFWDRCGLFFGVYRSFLDICLFPTPYESPITKFIITISIVAIYVVSDKRFRRLLLLLVLCGLVLMFPQAVASPIIGHWRYVYFTSVIVVGLFACAMNQGVEKLCGVRFFLSTVQPFFIETSKRRLLAAMLACWLFVHFDIVGYVLPINMSIYGYIRGSFQPTAEYSATYYLVLLITSLVLLGLAVAYVRASKGINYFIFLAVFCTFILMIPTFVPNFCGRLTYFTAALPIALLACAVGYIIGSKAFACHVDFKNPRTICLALLILMHSIILTTNYHYIQGIINSNLNTQKVRNWVAKPVGEFILQKEGYQGKNVYLLNFPYVTRELTRFGYEFVVPYFAPDYKRVAAYSCGLDVNAFDDVDIEALPGKIVQNIIVQGTVEPYDKRTPEISVDEFNKLTKNPDNKMLLLDNVTEQILDVSGMDFSRVQGLMGDEEKQKAFILP